MFRTADARSNAAQKSYARATATQLILLLVAAIGGSVSIETTPNGPDWGGVVAAGAFFTAAIVKLRILTTRPDRAWYESRALAESAKTLAWRYSVGGEPFPLDSDPADADRLLIQRLREVIQPLTDVALLPSTNERSQITEGMRKLRARPLAERRAAYQTARLESQREWYAARAILNDRLARRWDTITLAFEVLGAVAAVLKASGVEVGLLGLSSAIVAAVLAWTQMRAHANLSSAYAVAARELDDIQLLSGDPDTERQWAHFVEEAEMAISREHTTWRGARGGSKSLA